MKVTRQRLSKAVLTVGIATLSLANHAYAENITPNYWIPEFEGEGVTPHWVRNAQAKVLWGFVDRNGRFVIQPSFDEAQTFCGNSAEVRKGSKKFRIDPSGTELPVGQESDYHYKDECSENEIVFSKDICDEAGAKLISAGDRDVVVHEFHEGLAVFCMPMRMIKQFYPSYFHSWDVMVPISKQEEELARKRGYFGYVNEAGRIVVPPQFYRAGPFKDGLAQVETVGDSGNLRGGFIDSQGKFIGGRTFSEVFPFSDGLARVNDSFKNGPCGFINRDGKLIAEGLREASNFSQGVAPVKTDEHWALIDTKGQILKRFDFDEIERFEEGLAVVSKDGRKGFIDTHGDVVIPPRFFDAQRFSHGLSAVAVSMDESKKLILATARHDWKIGYIDVAGRNVIAPKYLGARHFSGGLVPVLDGLKWGYIDKAGRVAISAYFDDARSFSEGLAGVRIGAKWGFIDKAGAFKIAPQFIWNSLESNKSRLALLKFSEGMALAQKLGTWQYIDTQGKVWPVGSVDNYIKKENDFHEGRALVFDKWPKCGYADKYGKITATGFAGNSGSYSEGLANVGVEKQVVGHPRLFFGFIDKTGKFAIAPTYSLSRGFKEGLAAVAHGSYKNGRYFEGKWGFIDKKGEHVVREMYDDAGDFSEGLAPVKSGSKWGYIDKTGKTVVRPVYDFAGNFKYGLGRVKVGSRYGFISKTGSVAIPVSFWLAGDFSDGLAMVVYPQNKSATVSTANSVPFSVGKFEDLEKVIDDLPPSN